MAKRRRVKASAKRDDSQHAPATQSIASTGVQPPTRRLDPLCFGIGLLGGAIVYLSYHPSDSVTVEKGDALWFAALAIVISAVAWGWQAWTRSGDEGRIGFCLDLFPWLLAAWMMIAAWLSCPPGNLRMATNEAWLWVSAAAIFAASRRLMTRADARQAVLVLLVVCATGLATHGLHQYCISLPANRMEFQQDPERILRLAGVDAPPGSAERMVFANRLFDGGPTATFALANSLAGVLLVSVLLAVGVLRFHWHGLTNVQVVFWTLAAIVCASCMMAARSRSATLAALIGMAMIFIASSHLNRRNRRALAFGLMGVSFLGLACVTFMALFGNREWFEEAPASIAVRLQYWRSTWRMVLDHPLVGAGPGSFQSLYERYREITTTEQIAEPHNLFFETLASGGFIGLGLLICLVVAMWIGLATRWSNPSDLASSGDANVPTDFATSIAKSETCGHVDCGNESGRWLWLGASLSLILIWLIGWASRRVPDLDASLFVLPTVVIFAIALAPSIRSLADKDLDAIVGVALIALLIHLMVSGGWTVPGVAVLIWIGSSMLVRQRSKLSATATSSSQSDADSQTAVRSNDGGPTDARPIYLTAAIGLHLAILASIYWVSLRPVEQKNRLMERAAMAQASGEFGKARVSLQQACQADSWATEPMLWLADYYRQRVIAGGDTRDARKQWESSLDQVKLRAGDDPAVYRMVGAQQIHAYQRHGLRKDLDSAQQTFEKAAGWSPANQWMAAQLAEITRAQGQNEQSQRLADRAASLAEMGGNIERSLTRQMIYVARPIGRMAAEGPIRRPAVELLFNANPPQPAPP